MRVCVCVCVCVCKCELKCICVCVCVCVCTDATGNRAVACKFSVCVYSTIPGTQI